MEKSKTNFDEEEITLFLKKLLSEAEIEQGILIKRLEDIHREVDCLNREKEQLEEKIADHVSYFNINSARERERLPQLQKKILSVFEKSNVIREELQKQNDKILKISKVVSYVEQVKKESNNQEEKKRMDHISVFEVQDIERKRIARDLHDSTVQNLTNLVHKTELCTELLDKDVVQVRLELTSMIQVIRDTIEEMRKIIYDLHPMSIDDLGIVTTIRRYAEQLDASNETLDVDVSMENEERTIDSITSFTVFRVLQEACNNIIKHANATMILISLKFSEKKITLTVEDDGIGFELKERENEGFGLTIMKERASSLGGTFTIQTEKGKGTKVELIIPLEK